MLVGFDKQDITPRVGVGLYGYGPFLNRISIGARAPLDARAIAASDGRETVILVSCDLVGLSVCGTSGRRSMIMRFAMGRATSTNSLPSLSMARARSCASSGVEVGRSRSCLNSLFQSRTWSMVPPLLWVEMDRGLEESEFPEGVPGVEER